MVFTDHEKKKVKEEIAHTYRDRLKKLRQENQFYEMPAKLKEITQEQPAVPLFTF